MKGKKTSNKAKLSILHSSQVERRKLFKKLLDHVAYGYSVDCFPAISEQTILEFIKAYPEEFVHEELQEAMRKGKLSWEDIGHKQATGACLGNSRTWYYNMSHRYGWSERQTIEAEHKGSVQVNVVSYASSTQSKSKREQD